MVRSGMPLRVAEAFVLRSYPLKESDKIVSFYTREFGKCRGVARGARRPKSKFGSSLEPMTQIRVQFFEREGKELVSIDQCELMASMWTGVAGATTDLLHSMSIALMVEVAERMLPDREASDAVYRLMLAVTAAMRLPGEPWLPLTYYLLWMVRLGGFLPGWSDGSLPEAAVRLSSEMLRQPVGSLSGAAATAAGAAGCKLRQQLKWCIENHIESSLRSWPMLASLEPALTPIAF